MDSVGYRISLSQGAILFKEGEAGDKAYIVDKGEVGVSTRVNGENVQFAIASHGDILGEMALIDNGVRTATATVLTDTQLIVIPKEYIQRLISSSDPTVTLLMKIVMQRYREMKAHFDTVSSGGIIESVESTPKLVNSNLKAQTDLATQRVTAEQRLRTALESKQLQLHYQPVVDLDTGKIAGCEALIRWEDPDNGLIPPVQFIALAEETGLIEPIGFWIFEQAHKASQLIEQHLSANEKFFVSVNLSGRQIETDDQVEALTTFLLDNDIDLNKIKIEITESLLMSDPLRISQILTELKRFGCEIALDDFGTGYSSFSYLHRFPIDNIKIDRSFVSTMVHNPKSKAIVRTLCHLAKSLDMTTIAEGVENEQDVDMLSEFDCHYAQGYIYSKPVPLDEFITLLQN